MELRQYVWRIKFRIRYALVSAILGFPSCLITMMIVIISWLHPPYSLWHGMQSWFLTPCFLMLVYVGLYNQYRSILTMALPSAERDKIS